MNSNRDLRVNKNTYRNKGPGAPSSPQLKNGNHATGSIGHLAQLMGVRPVRLLKGFEKAGIGGITPNHVIDKDERVAFRSFFKRLKDSTGKPIYRGKSASAEQLAAAQDINGKLLQALTEHAQPMHEPSAKDFAELVAKLLAEQGCPVVLTKQTRDGVYDLLGTCGSDSTALPYLAECKRVAEENRVGVEVVSGLHGISDTQEPKMGLVVTSSNLASDVRKEKLRIGASIDEKEYAGLCDAFSGTTKNG